MKRIVALAILAVLITAGALYAGPASEDKAKEAAARPVPPSRLDALKKLTGEWVEVGEDGKPTDKVVAVYRTTAGGNVVQETIFGGTPHEMVTMYFMDNGELKLTHYCVAGNQPTMKAEKQTDPKTLVFSCSGGSNMKSENDEHMHHASLKIVDDNHIESEWLEYKDGKQVMDASFKLARK